MITDFLMDNAAVLPLALLLTVLTCAGVGYLLTRFRPGLLWVLVALSAVPLVALTLIPAQGGRGEVSCTVQFALPTFGRVELLANVALFFPLACFAALATARPFLTLLGAAAVSAAIETVQGLAPGIGRACDTNDWAMNTTGAAAGVLLAATVAHLEKRRQSRQDRGATAENEKDAPRTG